MTQLEIIKEQIDKSKELNRLSFAEFVYKAKVYIDNMCIGGNIEFKHQFPSCDYWCIFVYHDALVYLINEYIPRENRYRYKIRQATNDYDFTYCSKPNEDMEQALNSFFKGLKRYIDEYE